MTASDKTTYTPPMIQSPDDGATICKTCRFHDDFSGACGCGDSPYCADFTDDVMTCEFWEIEEAED